MIFSDGLPARPCPRASGAIILKCRENSGTWAARMSWEQSNEPWSSTVGVQPGAAAAGAGAAEINGKRF